MTALNVLFSAIDLMQSKPGLNIASLDAHTGLVGNRVTVKLAYLGLGAESSLNSKII